MVYLHRDPVDFRKAINGLVLIIEQEMELSPFAQALFIFCNRGRDKLKIVYWDDARFCCLVPVVQAAGEGQVQVSPAGIGHPQELGELARASI